MKHRKKNRILSRERSQRLSLLRGLSSDLLQHGTITTTKPKAQELRRYFEPLVTRARKGLTRHTMRNLIGQLRGREDVERLAEVAKRNPTRPGGYVRITKLPLKRADDASMVRVDILHEDSIK